MLRNVAHDQVVVQTAGRAAPFAADRQPITVACSIARRRNERGESDDLPDRPRYGELRQNNPSGKISLTPSGKSSLSIGPILSLQEGRSIVVTNVGEDAVDAVASARK